MTFSGQLDARTWTSSDGKAIEAEFIRYKDDANIVIKMKGKEFTVPLSKFSQADLDWLEQKKKDDAESAAENAEKVKEMTGRFDDKPIHSRLFPEAKDYFKDSDRKKVVRSAGDGTNGGAVNNGSQEEWMKPVIVASATNTAETWAGFNPIELSISISFLRSNMVLSMVTTTLRTTITQGINRLAPFPSK